MKPTSCRHLFLNLREIPTMTETPPPSGSRLGRGLDAMASEVAGIRAGSAPATGGGYARIPLREIHEPASGRAASPDLAASVKKYGILQPVLLAASSSGYELLAGSRRIKAAREAGLNDIPALLIPPERASALDVFLEENLTRADLSESDRIRLRERWMQETGRDIDQAEARIPEIQWESTSDTPTRRPYPWMAAAGVLAVVSIVLLAMVFNAKPVDRRPVVIPVEFVAAKAATETATQEPPRPDNRWMDAFVFPGEGRVISGSRLDIVLTSPLAEEGALTRRGILSLNQLAAVVLSSDRDLQLEITAPPPAESLAAAHLAAEGVPSGRIRARSGGSEPARFQIQP